MIVEALIGLVSVVLKALFSWINLPQPPDEVVSSITTYLDLIFNNLDFLGFFVRPSTMKVVAISAIALYTFDKLYKVTIWVYHKLPISSN